MGTHVRLLALALASTLLLAGPAGAGPRSKTWYRAESKGLPVTTVTGGWEDSEGAEVTLEFTGAHVLGAGTIIEAGWISPAIRSKAPSFEAEMSEDFVNSLGESFDVLMSVRVYSERVFRGWSPWIEFGHKIPPAIVLVGGGLGMRGELARPERFQFEWRLRLKVVEPVILNGAYTASISG